MGEHPDRGAGGLVRRGLFDGFETGGDQLVFGVDYRDGGAGSNRCSAWTIDIEDQGRG
jgi:hypothetical protein